jgi:cytochrome c-type biogenesis protein CcmH
MRKLFWIIALCSLFLGLASSQPVWAAHPGQEADPQTPTDDEVNAVAKELYCPVCENIPLDVCPTQACAQWRDLIRQKLVEGWSKNEIKNYFVEQYGERVLGAPPARGENWLLYLVPPIAIIAGAVTLYQALRSMRAARVQPAPANSVEKPANTVPDEYVSRLEEELRKKN